MVNFVIALECFAMCLTFAALIFLLNGDEAREQNIINNAIKFTKALEELEDFRSRECADIVAELLRHELPHDRLDSLMEIQGQLKLYEDDNAEMLLGQLLSSLKEQEGRND